MNEKRPLRYQNSIGSTRWDPNACAHVPLFSVSAPGARVRRSPKPSFSAPVFGRIGIIACARARARRAAHAIKRGQPVTLALRRLGPPRVEWPESRLSKAMGRRPQMGATTLVGYNVIWVGSGFILFPLVGSPSIRHPSRHREFRHEEISLSDEQFWPIYPSLAEIPPVTDSTSDVCRDPSLMECTATRYCTVDLLYYSMVPAPEVILNLSALGR